MSICILEYMLIEKIYMNDSRAAQQWPTMNGKPKSPAVAQSMRLGCLISAGLQCMLEFQRIRL